MFHYREEEPIQSLFTVTERFLKVCGKFGVPTPCFKTPLKGNGKIYYPSDVPGNSKVFQRAPKIIKHPQCKEEYLSTGKSREHQGGNPVNRLRKDISVVNLRAFLLNQPCQVLLGGAKGDQRIQLRKQVAKSYTNINHPLSS